MKLLSYHYNQRSLLLCHNIFPVFKINTKLFLSFLRLAFHQLGGYSITKSSSTSCFVCMIQRMETVQGAAVGRGTAAAQRAVDGGGLSDTGVCV
jgi:hypothetical protein